MVEETTPTTTETVDYKAEFEKMQSEYAKLKSNFDKTSSEVADYKRKDRERMSEEQKREAENAERETYYKELERKLAMKDYADELSDITDAKAKDNIVSLFADGKIVEALKAFKDFRAKDRVEMEKKIKTELLQQNPQANPQTKVGGLTKEQFDAMGVQERTKLYNEQPELYKKFTQ